MSAAVRLLRYIWAGYFFLWFLTFFLLFYPLFLIFLSNPKHYPKAHKLREIWGRVIMFLSGLRPKTTFVEKPDPNEHYIFVANHFSYLDILSLNVQVPNYFRFLAKSELGDIPLFKIFFRTIDIPVDRESRKGSFQSFEKAKIALENNESLGIFPEGGIGKNIPQMRRFRSGAFRLAFEQNVKVVPVSILDNHKLLPDGGFKSGGRPGKMRTIIHPALDPKDFDTIEAFRDKCYSIIQNTIDEHNFA